MTAHKSYGVIFGDGMVRALLAPPNQRKTVTRRLSDRWANVQPGDHLWVRETHALCALVHWPDLPHRTQPGRPSDPKLFRPEDGNGVAFYRASFDRAPIHWRSPLYLPRWAARLHLRVETVHQVSLGMITTHEAYKEGIEGERDPKTGEMIPSREVFLRKFRALNPSLPWVEYDGMLFLEPEQLVWRVRFRAWEYDDGCPWGNVEHPIIAEGETPIPCAHCGLIAT